VKVVLVGIALSGQTIITLVIAATATLLVGLEAILRLSEKLNLTDTSNQNLKTSQTISDEIADLNSAIQKLSEMHGHLNGLHLKSVNFKSPKFNIVDGWRLTTDQPSKAKSNCRPRHDLFKSAETSEFVFRVNLC
jgi:hypothetical protein